MLENSLKYARNQSEFHPSPQNLIEEMVVTARIHAIRFQKQSSNIFFKYPNTWK